MGITSSAQQRSIKLTQAKIDIIFKQILQLPSSQYSYSRSNFTGNELYLKFWQIQKQSMDIKLGKSLRNNNLIDDNLSKFNKDIELISLVTVFNNIRFLAKLKSLPHDQQDYQKFVNQTQKINKYAELKFNQKFGKPYCGFL